jgi:RNA polymerase sigma factor (sigma-70 family)
MTPRSLLAPARLAGQPVLRTQSDERLVDLVRAGSEPAFEAIVARYRRALLRYCSSILPEERAEDVVQQTFVRAYDSMLSSTRDVALRPWLYRIAHNTALNALRDRGLRLEELSDDVDGVEQPDQALERAQGLRSVLGAVQDLPVRQRDAIVLRELEGRTYAEIATELGVTGGAVRQLLNRARHSVRAAATAITPAGLLERIPDWGAAGGAAGGGALAAKAAATVLVTGAVVGGMAVAPKHEEQAADAAPATASPRNAKPAPALASGAVFPRDAAPAEDSGGSSGGSSGGRGGHGHGSGESEGGHRRGKGSGGDDPSSGGREGEDRSSHHGSGGADDGGGSGHGSSGSGSSGSGSSGSGSSGSGSSGSGSSGSGSGGPGGGSDGMVEAGAPIVTAPSGTGESRSGSGGPGSGSGGDDSLTQTGSN